MDTTRRTMRRWRNNIEKSEINGMQKAQDRQVGRGSWGHLPAVAWKADDDVGCWRNIKYR